MAGRDLVNGEIRFACREILTAHGYKMHDRQPFPVGTSMVGDPSPFLPRREKGGMKRDRLPSISSRFAPAFLTLRWALLLRDCRR
jgi:hypothetical protein